MRRIPVALTKDESAALNWLQHYAREDQLPPHFHPCRKLALHRILKVLSGPDLLLLIQAFQAAETRSTPTP